MILATERGTRWHALSTIEGVDTVIGWEAEISLAERVLDRARGHVPADVINDAEIAQSAGEHEEAVETVLEAGAPITEEIAAQIRRAWLDGRAADDWPEGREPLRRALATARIVET